MLLWPEWQCSEVKMDARAALIYLCWYSVKRGNPYQTIHARIVQFWRKRTYLYYTSHTMVKGKHDSTAPYTKVVLISTSSNHILFPALIGLIKRVPVSIALK